MHPHHHHGIATPYPYSLPLLPTSRARRVFLYFLGGIAPKSAEGRRPFELASNDRALRCPAAAGFLFHSTTVPLASALAKKVASTCHALAVMPAL